MSSARLKAALAGRAAPAAGGGGAAAVAPQSAPEIVQYDMAGAPSILTIGGSGTGKTHAIQQMLESGLNVLYVDIEDKAHALRRYRPAIVPLSAPIEERATGAKRPPTDVERYERLMAFVDALGEGKYREHAGRPFDLIAGDGLMEAMRLVEAQWRKNMPRAESTGSKDTFAMYGRIGADGLDLLAKIKRVANASAQLYGYRPTGMYWTVGEKRGEFGAYEPILPGRITADNLSYQFEAVLRLAVRQGVHVCYLRPEEGQYFAKVADCFDGAAELSAWNMGDIYRRLVAHYSVEAPAAQEGEPTTKTQ